MIFHAWCPSEERCADGRDYADAASAEIAAADYALLFAKRFGGSALTVAVESEGLPRRLVRVELDGERIARLEATDAPECVPGVRCALTVDCMLAAHHMGDRDPDLTACERCGAQPWEACR